MKIKLTFNISKLDELEAVIRKVSNINQKLIQEYGSDRIFEIEISLN